ncbi:hypothetical protein QQF64_025433 [Cirrhinus molitorella]|uniref:Secreted protein n=1 Tax=Cirrhinus molitorella TaxID=172907 RepID=A0ABR3NP00_9TELE
MSVRLLMAGRRAAGAGSVCLQLPGLHFLAFSVSKSSLPLANTYSHKHRHACWLHPARTLLLIGARSAFFFLFINFLRHPRKRISSGRRAREWRWTGSMTQGSGGSCVMTSLPGRG